MNASPCKPFYDVSGRPSCMPWTCTRTRLSTTRWVPKDLSEAARIDGCSEFRIFWQIILPLSRPSPMVVGLFQFMATWNDFLGPLIYLTDQKDFTLALGLQFFQSQQGGTEWHYLMAASTLVAAPIIILFFFTQKTFIKGISMTGLKG